MTLKPNQESNTPETDARQRVVLGGVGGDWKVVDADFARRLERERNEARKRGHDDMVAAVNNLAGDCPACTEVGFCGSYMSIVEHKGCAHAQLAEARAEAARLQMELDASCNAEELRQVREENARLRAKMAWLAGQLTDHPCACQWLDDTISELLTP